MKIKNFIASEFISPQIDQWLDVFEPATGEIYAQLAASESGDIENACSAAVAAFPAWSNLPPGERARHLNALASAIEARLEEFAQAESKDNGKPLSNARSIDIPRAIANFRFFAGAAEHYYSESHRSGAGLFNYTLRQPLGVVGCISPWNLPLYLLSWKIAPALAAGNTVVAKPSEVTPLTASLLGQACIDAGLPPGVLNIVQGSGQSAGAALVNNPHIKAISFTGSTQTGAIIARDLAGEFKKYSLEMGGKNPVVIFADCDFENAVTEITRAAFSNQGQICLCGSRILVEQSIYTRFRDALLEKVTQLKVGDPLEPDTQQGALVSAAHQQKVLNYIELAINDGGKLLCGGHAVHPAGRCTNGWFVTPTLIEGLSQSCRSNQEEIFGPVATIQAFNTEAEALAMSNLSDYGLACSLWSRDIDRCQRLAEQIEAGIIWINCWMERDLRTPFGGMKQSGVGREGGFEAMRFFTEPKNICIKFNYECKTN